MMIPVSKAAIKARTTLIVILSIPSVELYVKENATMPMAMIDGKERSISPAMTIIVSGMAIIEKKGMVDIKAK